ncbi:hypothetical protein [Zavarzinella formosa]|uniref:hypothetical protein n=1 Tax=Zavarzinella formosa TaxID=360055 RepID=UPI0012FAE18D|nr:hypothetical protein [Zavarzinella formosa]
MCKAEKKCTHCKRLLELKDFHRKSSTNDGHRSICKECRKTNHKNLMVENSEYRKAHLKRQSRYTEKNKEIVMSNYSNGAMCCSHCGYDNMLALSIDHVNGGGCKHRQEINKNFYSWLRKNGFPEGYQVLCMNCQFVKRHKNNEWHCNR